MNQHYHETARLATITVVEKTESSPRTITVDVNYGSSKTFNHQNQSINETQALDFLFTGAFEKLIEVDLESRDPKPRILYTATMRS